jgi:alkylhydroperoxidase family enzyme
VLGRGDGGVAHGAALIAFAEAVLGDDDAALDAARSQLQKQIGPAGLVDAAAVVGLFNAIDRIADATGIPLEPEKAAATADFRTALAIDSFATGRG